MRGRKIEREKEKKKGKEREREMEGKYLHYKLQMVVKEEGKGERQINGKVDQKKKNKNRGIIYEEQE